MAGALFSKVRLRLLSLFLGAPDQPFSASEVIRLAQSGSGAVQRELKRLTAAGLVEVALVSGRKLYRANRNSPIFKELRRLIIKTVGLAQPLRNALRKFQNQIDVAFVYGSVAKLQDTAKSDIDLMVVGRNLSYSEIYGALQKVESLLRRPINPNLMTPDDWNKKRAEGNSFVTRVLQQPKIFVFGGEDDLKKPGQSGERRVAKEGAARQG